MLQPWERAHSSVVQGPLSPKKHAWLKAALHWPACTGRTDEKCFCEWGVGGRMDVVVCRPAVLCGQQCPASPMHAPSPLFVSISASYSLLFLHPDWLHRPFSHPRGYSFLTIRPLASSSSEKKGGSQPCLPADARPDGLGWGTDAAGRGLGGARSGSRREEFGREVSHMIVIHTVLSKCGRRAREGVGCQHREQRHSRSNITFFL